MTKFFEPISVSATHIYHSALELCPTSSIVRRLYYDRWRSIPRFPRVVIGNPDSWDQTTSFSSKGRYLGSIWSPCGRFVATRIEAIVEIRNPLTFQVLAVLQPPTKSPPLRGPHEYSPDGRSLACGCCKGIVIWDIQTGGVARSINCPGDPLILVWSLDGKTLAAAHSYRRTSWSVQTYDVVSGAQLFAENFETEWMIHFWASEKAFRFLSIPYFSDSNELSISEIGPTRPKIEHLSVVTRLPKTARFSPSTYRIAFFGSDSLRILDARNSQSLLEENNIESLSFSSDASLVAATHKNGFRVCKYTPGSYVLLGEYLLPYLDPPGFSSHIINLRFSPASTSILSQYKNILQVWGLHGPPTTPKTCRQHAAISRSGRYVAIVRGSQSTVTIINLHSQAPHQFIDTGGEIEGLAITGNVLLVAFSQKVVGWLLTEEGRVNGLVDSQRADHTNSIWTITSSPGYPKPLCFTVSGQNGVIEADSTFPFIYITGTGGVSYCVHQPRDFTFPWVSLYQPSDFKEYYHLRHHDTPQYDAPPTDSWLASRTRARKAQWVVDPEGRHRFWLPFEWRVPWDPKNCHNDILTLFARIGDQPVIIKF